MRPGAVPALTSWPDSPRQARILANRSECEEKPLSIEPFGNRTRPWGQDLEASGMRQSGRVYDELLVLQVQAGDRRAFDRLAARWQPRLLRSARRFTGQDETACEAVQECWAGIASGIGGLRDPASFPGWAFAILRRRCAERVRALAASRTRWGSLADASEPSSSPRGEDRTTIVQAFDRLPEEQRIAATLFFVEQLKLDEIAAATGAPLGTVKSRIFAARRSLKTALQGDER